VKRTTFVFCLLVLAPVGLRLRSSEFPKLSGPYLGQTPPGMTAEKFAPGIASTNDHEHSRMEFSRDGLEMYWAVVKGEEQKIWVTRNGTDGWSKPAPLPLSFSETRAPVFGADGKLFYFFANDPSADASDMPPQYRLWVKSAPDTEWKNIKPVNNIIPQIRNKMTMSFCFAANGNLYFDLGGPGENGGWSWQIYFSACKNGSYGQPQLLGDRINEGTINQFPFVAPDEGYLIFSSNRQGNLGGGDLYVSFRDKNGNWLQPVNMGDKINTPGQERSPSVTPDGKYFFFARHNRETLQDFYWIDAKIIAALREEAH
jgi:hypothetical protein